MIWPETNFSLALRDGYCHKFLGIHYYSQEKNSHLWHKSLFLSLKKISIKPAIDVIGNAKTEIFTTEW